MQRPEPLIVTLIVDGDAQQSFDRLRQAHFPPERNHLAAHVTLFHALPGGEVSAVQAAVDGVCRRAIFRVQVSGVRFLGRGVAYSLGSAELQRLRGELAAAWQPWLTPQDRQHWSPHITVSNKLSPASARALHCQLASGFEPWPITAAGLAVWRYLGGPWKPVSSHPFHG